jgi:IS5 family transposase
VLARLDTLLDDDGLFQAVRADLARRRPKTLVTGRPSTPVEVVLRLLIVRRLYGWSYAQTEHLVTDSLILRQFCRLGLAPAPDDTTLLRWAALVRPATLDALLDHVVALARQLKVCDLGTSAPMPVYVHRVSRPTPRSSERTAGDTMWLNRGG